MRNKAVIIVFIFATLSVHFSAAQDSLAFKGQFSAYTHLNSENDLPWWGGIRYIPQVNYKINTGGRRLVDFEASANIFGNAGINLPDSSAYNGKIKPYRLWARYSSSQFELRAGLQKINFGSASILRPLMWFDQIDPRDPLKLTDGVWGLLARYYFLNNSNIWVWGLYGNENLKGWESIPSNKKIPEFGGRFQIPLPGGETAFTYHHRIADGSSLSDSINTFGDITENRFGLDAKFDMTVGWWVEASWSKFGTDIGMFTNQKVFNIGIDYTFGIGNGLNVIYEQLAASYDSEVFGFDNAFTFSLLSMNYPVGLFNNINTIFYYDWTNNKIYNFVNWQMQLNKLTLHLMAYANPREYNIPTQDVGEIMFAGSGLMILLVFNH